MIETPLGTVHVTEKNGAITSLDWGTGKGARPTALADQVTEEIAAYFAGDLTEFTVPLRPEGSAFLKRFLETLRAIPYGQTRTYGEIAADLGVTAQAAGQACGANPMPILIPCHRVLGASSLGGYSGRGGIETKVALLKLEGGGGLLI